MPLNDPKPRSMPVPSYEVDSNNKISDEVKDVKKPISKVEADNHTIEKKVADVPRTTPKEQKNPGIGTVAAKNVYIEPKVPDTFPKTADYIKSLDFAANDISADAKNGLSDYYNLCLKLMNRDITVAQYYAKMPEVIESIKGVVITETDWEDLRDSILRTQNYILNYLWTDMQNISKAMDTGFAAYQQSINDWINKANSWFDESSFFPQDVIKLKNLSNTNNGKDRHELAQNMNELLNSMTVRVSSSKPKLNYKTDPNSQADPSHFPQNKGLIWIEEINN